MTEILSTTPTEPVSGEIVIRAGFIPLVDSAPLVVASRFGFARAEGLKIELFRQMSWASLRDRLAVGHFDIAHMLAPMPIAANLGIAGLSTPTLVPMALGLGGNAITVSATVWRAMEAHGAVLGSGPAALGAALKKVVAERDQPLTLAMVHPFSAHNYELRYFLAASGIDPDQDTRLVVVPPPMMSAALASGQIDGFCVGEPWNSLAVDSGAAVVLVACAEIWRASPCKVLGLRADFVEAKPEVVSALLRAVERAAAWADDPANRPALADLLAAPDLLGVEASLIERALSGKIILKQGEAPKDWPNFLTFHAQAATFPWRSHALWFYSQMLRWGQVTASPEAEALAGATYRPDLYRAALSGTGAAMPNASAKVEGTLETATSVGVAEGQLALGPDGFFDGRVFDPEDIAGYLAGFATVGG